MKKVEASSILSVLNIKLVELVENVNQFGKESESEFGRSENSIFCDQFYFSLIDAFNQRVESAKRLRANLSQKSLLISQIDSKIPYTSRNLNKTPDIIYLLCKQHELRALIEILKRRKSSAKLESLNYVYATGVNSSETYSALSNFKNQLTDISLAINSSLSTIQCSLSEFLALKPKAETSEQVIQDSFDCLCDRLSNFPNLDFQPKAFFKPSNKRLLLDVLSTLNIEAKSNVFPVPSGFTQLNAALFKEFIDSIISKFQSKAMFSKRHDLFPQLWVKGPEVCSIIKSINEVVNGTSETVEVANRLCKLEARVSTANNELEQFSKAIQEWWDLPALTIFERTISDYL